MAKDILPPAPPGEQKPVIKEKKKGFLNNLFGKKAQAQPQEDQPSQPIQPAPPHPSPNSPNSSGAKVKTMEPIRQLREIPDDINLEDIRKQLGLEIFSEEEIPEPPKAQPEKEGNVQDQKDKEHKKERFDLPDIEAAIASSKLEQPVILDESYTEEPPKILPMEVKKEEDEPEKKKRAKAKPKKDLNEWVQDFDEEKEEPKAESEFSKDINQEQEQAPAQKEKTISDGKEEFTRELSSEDIKQMAKELERRKFEEKKNIKYEPEVIITSKIEEEAADEKREFLIDSSPGDELVKIKKRLLQKEEKYQVVDDKPELTPEPATFKPKKEELAPERAEKKEQAEKQEQPAVQQISEKKSAEQKAIEDIEIELPDITNERRVGGKLSILENESLDEPQDIPEEKPADSQAESSGKKEPSFETPSFIHAMSDMSAEESSEEKEEPVDTSELIKEMEKNLIEKIRAEEKSRVEKELEQDKAIFDKEKQAFDKEKQAFEKQKQALEQEKIAVAGKASRYDFKEKQMKREKAELDAEKEKFKREKEEVQDLMKKLPVMRKDYENLNEKMNEIYETLKVYSKKEEELRNIEKNIETSKQSLEEAQQRLEKTEQRIKEKGFSQYLETELKDEQLISHKLEEEQDITRASNLEIYNLIDECKTMIRDRNLSQAKKLYMRIREAYNSINIQGTEKDLLYTAVREIYDDIKLAEMESDDFSFHKF